MIQKLHFSISFNEIIKEKFYQLRESGNTNLLQNYMMENILFMISEQIFQKEFLL